MGMLRAETCLLDGRRWACCDSIQQMAIKEACAQGHTAHHKLALQGRTVGPSSTVMRTCLRIGSALIVAVDILSTAASFFSIAADSLVPSNTS